RRFVILKGTCLSYGFQKSPRQSTNRTYSIHLHVYFDRNGDAVHLLRRFGKRRGWMVMKTIRQLIITCSFNYSFCINMVALLGHTKSAFCCSKMEEKHDEEVLSL